MNRKKDDKTLDIIESKGSWSCLPNKLDYQLFYFSERGSKFIASVLQNMSSFSSKTFLACVRILDA